MAATVGFARFGFTLILPEMQRGLSLSTADMGLIATTGFVGYVVSAPFQGGLAATYGSRQVVAASLVVAGGAMGLTGLSTSLVSALVLQFIAGAAAAGANVPSFTIAGPWFEPARRGTATGVVLGGCGLGIVLVGLFLPPVLGAGPDGWRWSWAAIGIPTVLLGAATAGGLREPPGAAVASASEHRPRWTSVYRYRVVWALAVLLAAWGLSYIIYGTFFVKYLVSELGIDLASAGRLWALTGVISLASGLVGGVLSDRLGRPQALAAMFGVQGVVHLLFVLARATDAYWPPLVVSAVLYGLTAWGFGTIMGALTLDIVGSRLAPAATGLIVLCFGIGQAAGPFVAGQLVERAGTFVPAYLVSAAVVALGALGALRLPRGARHPSDEATLVGRTTS